MNQKNSEYINQGVDVDSIHLAISEYWPKQLALMSKSDLRIILDEMAEFGILGSVSPKNSKPFYRLRTQLVANMLGTEDEIIDELAKQESQLPAGFNSATYRRITQKSKRKGNSKPIISISPLTDSQLTHLFTSVNKSIPEFVLGTKVFNLDEVAKTLEEHCDTVNFVSGSENFVIELPKTDNEFRKACEFNAKMKDQTKLVVFTPTPKNIDLLLQFTTDAENIDYRFVKPILILDANEAKFRKIEFEDEPQILMPWGHEMLRNYMQYLNFVDDVELRTASTSKNWWNLR